MEREERVRLSAEVFGDLAWVVHRTSQDAAAVLRREDLNPAQFQLLLAVGREPGLGQHALGQRLGVTASNVSMLVSKLVDADRLRREAVGAANRIWLTRAGQELVDRLAPDQDLFMLARFAGLDDDELAQLLQLARRTREGLPREL